MTQFIAGLIDNVIMLVAAAFMIRLYFNPAVQRLYKKKWLIVGSAIMILYSVTEIAISYRQHATTRIPTKAELERAILANNTLASEDFAYHSPDGLRMLIPKGYAYTKFASGPFYLTAVNESSAIVVSRIPSQDALEKTFQDTCSYLKQKNSTYAFMPNTKVSLGRLAGVRKNFEVVKNEHTFQGVLLMFKKNNEIWQITMSCPQRLFAGIENDFERVIGSIEFD